MATVYLALDLKHQRPVAIKVLDAAIAASIGPDRFLREIETTASLCHPHVLPLFDSGAIDGLLFYVMPLAEGETLRHRLAKEHRLAVADALRITQQVADALGHAHAHGVVHRDIKPDNVLLESGHAVVADFGIAHVARASTHGPLTNVGTSLGTPAYMSPEQAAGDPNVDGRSDQYSLACVLFEMLAGQPPFAGPAAAIIRQHLTAEPPALETIRPDAPAALVHAIRRALAKDPAERFEDMAHFSAALEGHDAVARPSAPAAQRGRTRRPAFTVLAVAVALLAIGGIGVRLRSRSVPVAQASAASPVDSAVPDIATDPSIAVMPFENLSSDRDEEFFAEGVTDDLRNLLSQVAGLRVIARTSSLTFKGRDVAAPEIGRKLRVAALLEGSVQRAGSSVRIHVNLVRASDGSQIWADRYDHRLGDIFALQDEIAARVVSNLKVKLLGSAPRSRPVDPAAYALILRGNFLVAQGTPQSRSQGVDLLKQALRIDSTAVSAWVGLGVAYTSESSSGEIPAAEGKRLARAAIRNALTINPNDALSLSLIGWMTMNYDDDFVTAARYFQDALAQGPPSPSVVGNAAMFVQNLGRLDEAIAALQYQASRDPANPRIPLNLASTYLYAGRWDDAVRAARTVLAMSPGRTSINATMAMALLHKGDLTGALAAAQAEPSESARLPALAMVYHALGRRAEADSAEKLLASKYGADDPYDVAAVTAYRGDADAAFRWLDRAQANGDIAYIAVDPAFSRLRTDSRWPAFLRRAGKAPDQLAAIPFKLVIPK